MWQFYSNMVYHVEYIVPSLLCLTISHDFTIRFVETSRSTLRSAAWPYVSRRRNSHEIVGASRSPMLRNGRRNGRRAAQTRRENNNLKSTFALNHFTQIKIANIRSLSLLRKMANKINRGAIAVMAGWEGDWISRRANRNPFNRKLLASRLKNIPR